MSGRRNASSERTSSSSVVKLARHFSVFPSRFNKTPFSSTALCNCGMLQNPTACFSKKSSRAERCFNGDGDGGTAGARQS